MSAKDKVDSPLAAGTETPASGAGLPVIVNLPVVAPAPAPARRRLVRPLLLGLLLAAVAGGAAWRVLQPPAGLPAGFASGNGRLEADEIDIDTKFAGRIAKLLVDEGDLTRAGEVLALMDTQDLAASLRKSQAQVLQAQQALFESRASTEQAKSQVVLAQQQIARAHALVRDGFMTVEMQDQRQQALVGAVSSQNMAVAKAGQAEHALDAATHDAELYAVNIADNTLTAPRDGRIQYRVANVGEVLPAGGKIFTMLDTAYVYMDVYLPTLSAGRVKLGSDARIVLDAYPGRAFPAAVTFVAAQAQFTPKTVETTDERDLLMFRIRVRLAPELLRTHADSVRSGLPGTAYVRTDLAAVWPVALQGDAAK